MSEINNKYFECPVCQWAISFKFNYDKYKYMSTCPYCKNELEMEKEEYENDEEVYFKKEF